MVVIDAVGACYTLAMTVGEIIADFSVFLNYYYYIFSNVPPQILVVQCVPPAQNVRTTTLPSHETQQGQIEALVFRG